MSRVNLYDKTPASLKSAWRLGSAFFFVAVLLSSLVMSIGCSSEGSGATGGKVNVVASFYPLFEAARQVGGEKAAVSNLVPAGTEPHDFEPTPKQVASLYKATVVVFNGAGLEAWLDRVLPDLKKRGIVAVIASQVTDVLEVTDENNPSQKLPDPHIWLDPVSYEHIVNAVKDAYIQVDPASKSYYEANAAAYVSRLDALDKSYQTTLAPYAKRTIVTSHNAFQYLARRYGLDVIYIAGISPDAEPSAQQVAAITRLVKESGIKYIFFETLVSPRLAQTVAQEAGARTLVFNPVEGLTPEEIASGENYITVMQQNLANLKTALEAENE